MAAEEFVKSFDRSQFVTSVDVIVLQINVSKTNEFMKRLKPHLFNRPKMRSVLTPQTCPTICTSNDMRGIILSEEVSNKATNDNKIAGLPLIEQEWVLSLETQAVNHKVEVGYELLSVEQVLRQVLPSTISEIPSSFETAGHVAHLNLREDVLPYKFIVAQVILDKNTRVKTVVNKTASIATEYRTFPLELLGGHDNVIVELKEGGASFKFDFRNVYWNSRLQQEHRRLADLISIPCMGTSPPPSSSSSSKKVGTKRGGSLDHGTNPTSKMQKQQNSSSVSSSASSSSSSSSSNDASNKVEVIVADLMGGVGPFAIPLAQRGCIVHANDLNPESYKWLLHNIKLNKIPQDHIYPSNGDAREFVTKLRGRQNLTNHKNQNDENNDNKKEGIFASNSIGNNGPIWFDHAIMNLPQTAIEFLDAFQGYLYTGSSSSTSSTSSPVFEKIEKRPLPMIHVYCFEKETDGTSESAAIASIERCSKVLEFNLKRNDVNVHVVRYVSPQKPMLCLSFRLPHEVASRPPKY